MHRRLSRLRLVDHAGHLSELGRGADRCGSHHEQPGGVDSGAHHSIGDGDGHRQALTSEQRHVDLRCALNHLTVGGDAITGAHEELVADDKVGDIDLDETPVGLTTGDLIDPEVQESAQRLTGSSFRSRLEVAATENEGDHR